MALLKKVGSIASPTSTGNQSYTGLGFQPKLVLFWYACLPADGNQGSIIGSVGAAVSSSDRRYVAIGEATGKTTTEAARRHSAAACACRVGSDEAVWCEGDLVSMDSDGFTINWTTVQVVALSFGYCALGGSDITNVKTGQVQGKASTGTQAVTGVGFQPDLLVMMSANNATAPPDSAADAALSVGVGTSTAQAHLSVFCDDAVTTTATNRYQRTNSITSSLMSSGTLSREAALQSLDSDGFTLNWSTANSTQEYLHYVAIKTTGSVAVGSFNQPTSTGNSAVSGVGFQPSTLLCFSFMAAASGSVQANARWSVGAMSDASDELAWFCG